MASRCWWRWALILALFSLLGGLGHVQFNAILVFIDGLDGRWQCLILGFFDNLEAFWASSMAWVIMGLHWQIKVMLDGSEVLLNRC